MNSLVPMPSLAIAWLLGASGISAPEPGAASSDEPHGAAVTERPDGDAGRLQLAWDAPPDCPDAAEVRQQLERLLDGSPERDASARGQITREDDGFVLRLEVDGGAKELRAAECEPLGRAAALLLSIALSPDAGLVASPDEPDPPPSSAGVRSQPTGVHSQPATVPSQPPPPVVPSRPPPPLPSPPSSPDGLRGVVRLESSVQYGLVPTLSDAVLVLGARWPRARLEVLGRLWTPANAPLRFADERRALVTMGAVDARGCGVLRTARLEFPLCGGFGLGALRVDEITPGQRTIRHRLWVGVSASAALVWPFRRHFALWVGPEVLVAANRSAVPLNGGGAYQVGPAAIRGAVGFEVRFP